MDVPDDVRVLELLEERNLTDGSGGDAFVLGLETDLLQSEKLSGTLILGLVDDTIGTFSDLFKFLVLIHFDKCSRKDTIAVS